ncbi:MAG: AarF/UbiB family protein, partial [Proteobacteria bacterium]|nr:AarF/UbiB family protein [Pseudomonadota bacterium]
MMFFRLLEITLKLTLCLPFKGKYIIIRIIFLPLHILFLPHYVFMVHYKRMKCLLESLGTVFIKLGQSLSLKSFLFEKPLLEVLSHLQDSVQTLSTVDIKKHLAGNHISENLGFLVEEKPISTASVAHVYKGKMFHRGTEQIIAIKVIKNGIRKQIEKDFTIVYPLVKLASKFLSPALQIVEVAKDIHTSLLQEVNLNNEAQNLMAIKRNVVFDATVKVPQVFLEYSNETTLVMEFIDGVSVRKIIHGEYVGMNRKTIARNIVETYLNQVYRDGTFHADMHSGNILVMNDCTIALLDFGIVSSITKKDRRAVATMIYAFL